MEEKTFYETEKSDTENPEIETEEENREDRLEEELVAFFRSRPNRATLLLTLDNYHENNIAGAFEKLEPSERERIYPLLGAKRISDIFAYLQDPEEFAHELDVKKLASVVSEMDADDAVDFLSEMDDEFREEIQKYLDQETKDDIQLIQSYDDNEVGSKITTNFILIERGLSVPAAMKELVKQAGENDNISTIYVEDENHQFYGAIELKDLIISRKDTDLETLISTQYPYLRDHETIDETIERVKDYAEDSLPVLNDRNEVIGVITSQDIVEVVDEEMGEDYAKLAGLTAEEDLKEPLFQSIRKRIPWLLALLALGLLVSSVVSVFTGVVAVIPVVISFQSLVLDMAGNSGTQSLAVTIRVLMDENLSGKEKFRFVMKEMRVGFCNGLILGSGAFLLVGCYLLLIKGEEFSRAFMVSGCVGVALWCAMIIAAAVGSLIPMFFKKIKVDPAVASGPFITTINDLVAVVAYYGLCYLFFIQIFHVG